MTLYNVTCTGTARNFTKTTNSTSSYLTDGIFKGDNLIWLICLGAVAFILLILVLYCLISSAAGPKLYHGLTPHVTNLPVMELDKIKKRKQGRAKKKGKNV